MPLLYGHPQGEHVAMRSWWVALMLVGCFGDHDPPELIDFKPVDGVDLRGVGEATVLATYRDDSDVTTRVFVDSTFVGIADRTCGDEDDGSCHAEYLWSTLEFPPGLHDLTIALEDDAGNVTTETHVVELDDIMTITGMRVANIVDESGTLEIEVYAFDDANTLIGCSGSRHGLATVDNAGIEYMTEAVLITLDGYAFGTAESAGGRFRLEVWEDDDTPVCPAFPEPTGNDLVGRSPSYTAEEWRSNTLLMFDNVTKLGVEWARPLQQFEDPDPPQSEPPPLFGGGDSGCQAARGGGSWLALAGVFGLAVRRRRRQRQ